ncbi:cysteine hydrolase family protein [Fusobacterium sp. THCT1E2]
MKKTVLLVVDVQTALILYGMHDAEKVTDNINSLIEMCRKKGIEVIFVRHDSGKGSELEHGTSGWKIYSKLQPAENEKIFDKIYNSALRKTGLKEYLESKEIERIILTGMQTEYCIDATCKAAFEYGYELIIPKDAVTTCDNGKFSAVDLNDFYVNNIWKNRFAQVIDIEDIEF